MGCGLCGEGSSWLFSMVLPPPLFKSQLIWCLCPDSSSLFFSSPFQLLFSLSSSGGFRSVDFFYVLEFINDQNPRILAVSYWCNLSSKLYLFSFRFTLNFDSDQVIFPWHYWALLLLIPSLTLSLLPFVCQDLFQTLIGQALSGLRNTVVSKSNKE